MEGPSACRNSLCHLFPGFFSGMSEGRKPREIWLTTIYPENGH